MRSRQPGTLAGASDARREVTWPLHQEALPSTRPSRIRATGVWRTRARPQPSPTRRRRALLHVPGWPRRPHVPGRRSDGTRRRNRSGASRLLPSARARRSRRRPRLRRAEGPGALGHEGEEVMASGHGVPKPDTADHPGRKVHREVFDKTTVRDRHWQHRPTHVRQPVRQGGQLHQPGLLPVSQDDTQEFELRGHGSRGRVRRGRSVLRITLDILERILAIASRSSARRSASRSDWRRALRLIGRMVREAPGRHGAHGAHPEGTGGVELVGAIWLHNLPEVLAGLPNLSFYAGWESTVS